MPLLLFNVEGPEVIKDFRYSSSSEEVNLVVDKATAGICSRVGLVIGVDQFVGQLIAFDLFKVDLDHIGLVVGRLCVIASNDVEIGV